MYAITDSGYRAIQEGWELQQGETLSENIPQSLLATIRSDEARVKIRALISATNWAMMEDADLSALEKSAIRSYRAALRLLPEHPDFPDMEWPVLPRTNSPGNETGETS